MAGYALCRDKNCIKKNKCLRYTTKEQSNSIVMNCSYICGLKNYSLYVEDTTIIEHKNTMKDVKEPEYIAEDITEPEEPTEEPKKPTEEPTEEPEKPTEEPTEEPTE